jgi:predicted nuclease of restriction endonuclease-like (RecB) superfamily
MPRKRPSRTSVGLPLYDGFVGEIADLLAAARRASARAVNALMTATYWEIGRRIVEFEQGGAERAEYGEELLERLAADLTARFGRGFSRRNLQSMRLFYAAFPPQTIWQTLSAKSAVASAGPLGTTLLQGISGMEIEQTTSAKFVNQICSTSSNNSETPSRNFDRPPLSLAELARALPLPWSQYVLLISRSRSPEAMEFYHAEALRGGWSVRQLQRQIDSQFYERTALSRDKAKMLTRHAKARPDDALTADEEVKDPLVLEFLGLKDEYSESDLEEALVSHLEHFLLELGNDFAFIARQRRLRIDDEWYRVDLLFFHRVLRCLVVIDLKLGKFTHADAGQMHLYLNYAREHWTQDGENPPVGLILCADKGEALVRYATDNLPNKVVVRRYLTALPAEKLLAAEIAATRKRLERRR